MSLLNSSRRALVFRWLAAIALLAIAVVAVIPNYGTGDWTWANPPNVPHQDHLRALKDDGLTISDWQTTEQYSTEISGLPWSVQALVPDAEIIRLDEPVSVDDENRIRTENPAIALFRPQTWYRDMPQVEWMDINGVQKWETDQRTSLTFTVAPEMISQNTNESHEFLGDRPVRVHTRFFRGWSRQQTYAVMQWYAWPTGGSPSASQWFWVDQRSQLRDRHRMPWVAVSIMIPIKPLGDIQSARSIAENIGQHVQASLIRDVFSENA